MTSHKAGGMHQNNKVFKKKHRSKGAIKSEQAGKVSRPSARIGPKAKSMVDARINRKNAAKLTMVKKREDGKALSVLFTGRNSIPKTGVIVPLCAINSVDDIVPSLMRALGESYDQPMSGTAPIITDIRARYKQRLQWLALSRSACPDAHAFLFNVLDACKAADFVLFVVSCQEEVDDLGYALLSAIRSQGLATCFTIAQGSSAVPARKLGDIRKSLTAFVEHETSNEAKIYFQDVIQDCQTLLRSICETKPKTLEWREANPYVLAQEYSYIDIDSSEPSCGTLKIAGFTRGRPLSANRLMHIGSFGDFPVAKIEVLEQNLNGECEVSMTFVPTADGQGLTFENSVEVDDSLSNADNSMISREENLKSKIVETRKVPRGTSEYQAEWLAQSDVESLDEEIEEEGSMMDDASQHYAASGKEDETDHMDEDEAARCLANYLSDRKQRDQAQQDLDFPDEVDTPIDIPARFRFRKYRGLKSFRTSSWDPYENLPEDYGRIFQFESYKKARRDVIENLNREVESCDETLVNGPFAGSMVYIYLKNVPLAVKEFYENLARPLVVFGLLPYEEKMSVLNMSIFRPTSSCSLQTHAETLPIVKNKDDLIIQCGFRRYRQSVLVSQQSKGKLQKMERFLHPGTSAVISAFAPVQMSSPPVLFFMPKDRMESNNLKSVSSALLGSGSFLSADPNRMVIKRKLLTGIPTRIHPSHHRNTAVIRFMFFNAEDIEYFKPIELRTKLGLRGHILSSIGTHGVMKCGFDKPLKSMDTICLPLYKRVYPKWPKNGYKSLFGMEAAYREFTSSQVLQEIN